MAALVIKTQQHVVTIAQPIQVLLPHNALLHRPEDVAAELLLFLDAQGSCYMPSRSMGGGITVQQVVAASSSCNVVSSINTAHEFTGLPATIDAASRCR